MKLETGFWFMVAGILCEFTPPLIALPATGLAIVFRVAIAEYIQAKRELGKGGNLEEKTLSERSLDIASGSTVPPRDNLGSKDESSPGRGGSESVPQRDRTPRGRARTRI